MQCTQMSCFKIVIVHTICRQQNPQNNVVKSIILVYLVFKEIPQDWENLICDIVTSVFNHILLQSILMFLTLNPIQYVNHLL